MFTQWLLVDGVYTLLILVPVQDPNYRRATVEISNVLTYSFAEVVGGGYSFWAAGQAGWFEIETTTSSYKPIYDEMGVAASMLYYLADKLHNSRKSKFKRPESTSYIRCLFKNVRYDDRSLRLHQLTGSQYLANGAYPTRFANTEAVKDGFNKHREFLIAQMLEKHEGIDWEGSPIMNYFLENFPVLITFHPTQTSSC